MAFYQNTDIPDYYQNDNDTLYANGDVVLPTKTGTSKSIKYEYPEGVCECLKRPKECICFKKPAVSHHSDGTESICWHTPPPSPILKHYDNIKEWGITNKDTVYIKRVSDDKRIESKKKITEYAYPHCHSDKCLQYPSELYYNMIAYRFGKPLPEPYAEEMKSI